LEDAKKAAQLNKQELSILMGKIQVAQGDLSVAVSKKNRLSRAKEILMMRSGIEMNTS